MNEIKVLVDPRQTYKRKREAKGPERNYCTLMLDKEGEQRRKLTGNQKEKATICSQKNKIQHAKFIYQPWL